MENNIHVLRMRQQLTQQELADAVNVTRQTINAIENNKYDPTLSLGECQEVCVNEMPSYI
ncbi:transcriptional regulator, y4mF family [Lacticaseibacillus paracasei]|uniref:Transcriptional regulator, y4mF family n=1 Tax=Lacticaseibacillus paracasei TaxID=1597 RepID=A0A422MDT2_LACPA|nr:helix-turn-helix transcriptional regulator [Lacticaseibacillus paracasei]RND87245.1 transcriptional regulator, y4mF family [Lacticaseibacillus paracasei]